MTVRYAELFAGIGGLGEGLKRRGAECVFVNEHDKYAVSTYAANNPSINIDMRDVREVRSQDIPPHDILCAGFPCQPFSVAGISKRRALGVATGLDCSQQGNLFFEVMRIIASKHPRIVVMENVKHLVSHDCGRTFTMIRDSLLAEGYATTYRILDAAAWLPQHRERVFIVAVRGKDGCCLDHIPVPRSKPTLARVLHQSDGNEQPNVPYTHMRNARLYVDEKYTLTDHMWSYLQAYKARHQAKGNGFGYGLVNQGQQSRTLSARYYKDGAEILVDQGKRNPRRLTPRECSRLMGFDQGRTSRFAIPVSDGQAYKQFGNAVAVPCAEAIARCALECV